MFRVKIAVLSVLISGAVLIVFGVYLLNVVHRIGLDRIDRELLTLGESQLHVWHPKEHWHHFDETMHAIYGREGSKDLIVQVVGGKGDVLYRSDNWPPEMNASLLAGAKAETSRFAFPGIGTAPPLEEPAVSPERPGHPVLPPAAERPASPPLPPPPPRVRQNPIRIKPPFFHSIRIGTVTWRIGIMGNQHITILIGRDLAVFNKDSDLFLKRFLLSVPMALVLLAVGGWLIAHRALKPVALITRTAKTITARGLDRRIPETESDGELLDLIRVLNGMLDRLEKSFLQAVRFSADAAHELQTPLTILQGVLDDAVQHALAGSDEQQRYGSLLEEVQRLKSIVRKLLILAQADADRLALRLVPVDLNLLVESAAEDAEIMAPGLSVKKYPASQVTVQADPDLLGLVLRELSTNAVKYNRPGGMIRFGLEVKDRQARLAVINTGNAIPEMDYERIFHRFFRLDRSRGHGVSGSGLGLSLAREIVRAHQGDLRLVTGTEDMITFLVILPC